jgi:beta-glucanase (GH16 family)
MEIFHIIIQRILYLMLCMPFICPGLQAQNRELVWADEFNNDVIDRSTWQFESGPSNDNVQFYTDRSDNAKIVDGMLQIISLKESYQGYEYTSAHIRTEQAQYWKYGRIEARIRVPGTPGFVPAFWMLPAENMYGWWPLSGEIDIMEHPSNEITRVYGTVHTEKYNLFSGSLPPQGGVIEIPDAETAFHLYAVECSPDKIDFFVDDQKYYSFENDNGASDTWPFDQSFYIILNLAVGGGWVGPPDENTIFPAIMEVDYVRVYQDAGETSILGADFVTCQDKGVKYSLGELEGAVYQWSVPGDAQIVSGQGTGQVTVDWGLFGGEINAEVTTGTGTYLKDLPVKVAPNYLKNPGFEKGVKYWNKSTGYPVKANFSLTTETVHQGDQSLHVEVTIPDGNPWDIQLSQKELMLLEDTTYHVSFWAKAEGNQGQISAAVIDQSDFSLVAIKNFTPSPDWTVYEFDFTASTTIQAAFNIDLGGNTGNYYFDDFILNTQQLVALNQLINPDFFENDAGWDLITLSGAEATGKVEEGEYKVTITNAGVNPWDIYFGQNGLVIENGIKYRVSFNAYSDISRQISALVGKNSDPWTVYSGEQLISLTTEKQTYSFSFTMTEPDDFQARLGFDIGGDGNSVYFDNILLENLASGDTSTNINYFRKKLSILQPYPNPFYLETSFYYFLPEPATIILKLFNLNGQEIRTIISEYQQQGNHQVTWKAEGLSAGTYIYRFDVDDQSETGKLILLR